MNALVTVAMPTWNTPGWMLREAVDSVLAQDVPLRLVVVNDASPTDPWAALADVDDDRLVRFTLERNRGCYYAESLVLAAARTEYWTVHAADDWSSPGRFKALLANAGSAGAVASPCAFHRPGEAPRLDPIRGAERGHGKLRTVARHPAHLYRTDLLRTVGIPSDLRGSADTAVVSLFWHRYEVATIPQATYHVREWPGSLTRSAATGLGTEWRAQQRAERRRRFEAALATGGRLTGYSPAPAHVRALKAVLART